MSQPPEQPTASTAKPFIIAITVALAIATGYAYYQYVLAPEKLSETRSTQPLSSAPKQLPSPPSDTDSKRIFDAPSQRQNSAANIEEPAVEIAAAEPLPELDSSDSMAHQKITALLEPSADTSTDEIFTLNSEFIRKLVLAIDNLSRGEISNKYPAAHIQVSRFEQSVAMLKPQQEPPRYTMGEETFARYNRAVDIFSAIDKAALATLYIWVKPLLQQSYNELGHAETSFDKVAIKAIDQLLNAPNIDGDIELTRPSVMFQYADPALEQRSASDKLMLRLGADNRRKFKAALRELKAELSRP